MFVESTVDKSVASVVGWYYKMEMAGPGTMNHGMLVRDKLMAGEGERGSMSCDREWL